MSCTNRHTAKRDGVWRLGQAATVGVMTDTTGEITWHTKCLACGIYSDPIPAQVASKWGVPSFDVSMTTRTLLGFDQEIMAEGWYSWKITECEQVAVKSARNRGKPMYKTTFMVTEGTYTGRSLSKWVCLFEPAWFVYENLCNALDLIYNPDEVYEVDTFLDQHLRASVKWEPGFNTDEMVAAIDRFAKIGSDPANQGKIRIAI